MKLQTCILMLLISLVLGQSLLDASDVHAGFEEHVHSHTDTDTQHHAQNYSDDDCGHCCHAHGCCISMAIQSQRPDIDSTEQLTSRYQKSLVFYYSDPAIRPPIA